MLRTTYSQGMDTADTTDRETVAVAVAARMLRVDPRTVRRWIHSGRFGEVLRPGHAWELPVASVRALLAPFRPEA